MNTDVRLEKTRRAAPTPQRTRTNHDWIMVLLGVLLIVLFVVIGYLSLVRKPTGAIMRGPVKDPNVIQSQSAPEKAH